MSSKKVLSRAFLVALGILFALLLLELVFHLFPTLLPDPVQFVTRRGRYAALGNPGHTSGVECRSWDDYVGVYWLPCDKTIKEEGNDRPPFRLITRSLGFDGIAFKDDGIQGPVFAVAVGDSMTEGNAVPTGETWVSLLEQRIGLDVVNMGVRLKGSLGDFRMMERYGLALHPRLILWGFYGGNDYGDTAEELRGAQAFKRVAQVGNRDLVLSLKGLLRRHSTVFEWALFLLKRSNYYVFASNYHYVTYKNGSQEVPFRLSDDSGRMPDLSRPEWQDIKTGFVETQRLLHEAKLLSEKQESQLVVLLFPTKLAAYQPVLNTLLPGHDHDYDWPTRILKPFLEEEGIPYLDLTPEVQARSYQQPHFDIDGHWNPTGHHVVADIIYSWLKMQNLLPQ